MYLYILHLLVDSMARICDSWNFPKIIAESTGEATFGIHRTAQMEHKET